MIFLFTILTMSITIYFIDRIIFGTKIHGFLKLLLGISIIGIVFVSVILLKFIAILGFIVIIIAISLKVGKFKKYLKRKQKPLTAVEKYKQSLHIN